MENRGGSFIQKISELELFRDKLRQFLFFSNNSIKTPMTNFYKGELPSGELESYEESSYIVKTRRGMRGLGVTYVENKKSLLSLLKTQWAVGDQNFIIQPYLEGTEFRYFIIDKKIHSLLKKDRQKNIIGNATSSSLVTLQTNNMGPSKVVEKIIQCLDSHYYAIDIIEFNGEQFVLEVNLAPGFEQLEALTGDNIAKMLWQKNR